MHLYLLIWNGLYFDSNERRFLYVTTIAVNSNMLAMELDSRL